VTGGVLLPFRNHVPAIAPDAFVAANATLIGQVEIGARANIWFGCVLRGDLAPIHVGALTNVQDGTVVHVSSVANGATWIGERVTIGHMALIHACRLEDRCFVGMKACVMDGAVVETGAWIGAGAVVTPGKRVKSGELWTGTPARLLRAVTAEEAHYIETLPERYAELAEQYR
jgi:carbonic anhydrase/acetyltransferase-like protein (isoleucine patch superfamily)